MTTDTIETTPASRSSLLYAMGRLQALNEAQADDIKALPERVFALVNPRIVAVEKLTNGFETRIRALERWRWVLVGGGGVILTLVTLGSGLAPQLEHLRL